MLTNFHWMSGEKKKKLDGTVWPYLFCDESAEYCIQLKYELAKNEEITQ